jgi:hypothetical protein
MDFSLSSISLGGVLLVPQFANLFIEYWMIQLMWQILIRHAWF